MFSDPMEPPLSVAISVIMQGNKVLLLETVKGPYAGLIGLPGGKIEGNEHASDAAVRELLEESGIKSKVKKCLGVVSELFMENNEVRHHFMLSVFDMEFRGYGEITDKHKGRKLEWLDLSTIKENRQRIIPSDFLLLERLAGNTRTSYYDCVLEKEGDTVHLRKFEEV